MTHTIKRPLNLGEWQALFLDAIDNAKTVQEVNEWVDMNAHALNDIERDHKDTHNFIMQRMNARRGMLAQAPN